MFKNTLLSKKQATKTALSVLCFFLATTATASTYIVHVVEKGESLNSLSKEFNVPVKDIKARNKLQSDILHLGKEIIIPIDKVAVKQVLSSKANVVTPKTADTVVTKKYRVRFDDTLSAIAKKHNTTLADLLKINKMKLSDTLLAGKLILVPTTATAKVSPKEVTVKAKQFKPSPLTTNKKGQLVYTVQKGDIFQGIAKQMKIPASKLQKLNNIDDVNNLMVGQKIIVRDTPTKLKSVKAKVVKPKVVKAKAVKAKAVKEKVIQAKIETVKGEEVKTVVSTPKISYTKKPALAQKISFSAKKTPQVKPKATPKYITYTVQNGDTVTGVAKYFGVKKEDIIKFNKLDKSEYIKVGSSIIIAEKK